MIFRSSIFRPGSPQPQMPCHTGVTVVPSKSHPLLGVSHPEVGFISLPCCRCPLWTTGFGSKAKQTTTDRFVTTRAIHPGGHGVQGGLRCATTTCRRILFTGLRECQPFLFYQFVYYGFLFVKSARGPCPAWMSTTVYRYPFIDRPSITPPNKGPRPRHTPGKTENRTGAKRRVIRHLLLLALLCCIAVKGTVPRESALMCTSPSARRKAFWSACPEVHIGST